MTTYGVGLIAASFLEALAADDQERVKEIERAWRYYRGDQPRQVARAKDGRDRKSVV